MASIDHDSADAGHDHDGAHALDHRADAFRDQDDSAMIQQQDTGHDTGTKTGEKNISNVPLGVGNTRPAIEAFAKRQNQGGRTEEDLHAIEPFHPEREAGLTDDGSESECEG